jgi:hypothetical protein
MNNCFLWYGLKWNKEAFMIEKYLKRDVVISWARPLNEIKSDYIPGFELVGQQYRKIMTDKKNKTIIMHDWLPYSPAKITWLVQGCNDVLSGFFTGCFMVAWKEENVTYVGHVGTDSNSKKNSKAIKEIFVERLGGCANVRGFNPSRNINMNEDYNKSMINRYSHGMNPSSRDVLGFVTVSGGFYSVLTYRISHAESVIAVVTPASPMSGDDLFKAMLNT